MMYEGKTNQRKNYQNIKYLCEKYLMPGNRSIKIKKINNIWYV